MLEKFKSAVGFIFDFYLPKRLINPSSFVNPTALLNFSSTVECKFNFSSKTWCKLASLDNLPILKNFADFSLCKRPNKEIFAVSAQPRALNNSVLPLCALRGSFCCKASFLCLQHFVKARTALFALYLLTSA